MATDILKAVIVGICASIPPGPVLALVLGKCLGKGAKSGFVTALGSVTVDLVYTAVALFALKYFQSLMDTHQKFLLLCGGLLLIGIGLYLTLKAKRKKFAAVDEAPGPGDYFQAMGVGFSNPGAVAMIFALLAIFNVGNGVPRDWHMLPLIAAETVGEILYWSVFTHYAAKLKDKISVEKISLVNLLMGVAIVIFGIVMLVRALIL